MSTLTFVSQLHPGDMLDLEDDVWADVPTSMLESSRYACDRAIVESIVPDADDFIAVTFEAGETVSFPGDHQVRKVTR